MNKVQFGFNHIGEDEQAQIKQALNDGNAVCVIPTCIGHTRAKMVEAKAEYIFKMTGAKIVLTEHAMFDYWALERGHGNERI